MILDNRLSACARYVSGNGIAADVGTDHGYLPCYLVKNGVCDKVIASDINRGPLDNAREHIESEGLVGSIQTVLSDGLDEISADGVSDVIIAGMGGELIAQILQRAKGFYGANFILQPMTKIEYLRGWLWDTGFEILSESACKDEFYYTVMQARYTGIRKDHTELDTYIGALRTVTDEEKGFLLRQAQKLRQKGEGLMKSTSRSDEGERYINLSDGIIAYVKGEEKQ